MDAIVLSLVTLILVSGAGGSMGAHPAAADAVTPARTTTMPPTDYWNAVLPETPMPQAIHDLLTQKSTVRASWDEKSVVQEKNIDAVKNNPSQGKIFFKGPRKIGQNNEVSRETHVSSTQFKDDVNIFMSNGEKNHITLYGLEAKKGIRKVTTLHASQIKKDPREATQSYGSQYEDLRKVTTSYGSKGEEGVREVTTTYGSQGEEHLREISTSYRSKGENLREVSTSYGSQGEDLREVSTSYGSPGQENLREVSTSYGSQGEDRLREVSTSYGSQGKEDLREVSTSYRPQGQENLREVSTSYDFQGEDDFREVNTTYGSQGEEKLREVSISYGSKGQENIRDVTTSYRPQGQENLREVSTSYGFQGEDDLREVSTSYGSQGEENLREISTSYGSQGQENLRDVTTSYRPHGQKHLRTKATMSLKSHCKDLRSGPTLYGSPSKDHSLKITMSDNQQSVSEKSEANKGGRHRHDHVHMHSHSSNGNKLADVFFFRDALRPGSVITPTIPVTTSLPPLLPRREADSLPFATERFADIVAMFAPASLGMADEMRWTLDTCEHPRPLPGERAGCATSLEALAQLPAALLGTRNLRAFSGDMPIDPAGAPARRGRYNVTAVVKLSESPAAATCHDLTYPYAVFFCHTTNPAAAYMVTLAPQDGSSPAMEALAVCHLDTSLWSPTQPFLVAHNLKPGEVAVCHFLSKLSVIWVPAGDEQGGARDTS